MLRYKTKTRPGLVALYDIRPGNGAGPFLQPRSPHGAMYDIKYIFVNIVYHSHGIVFIAVSIQNIVDMRNNKQFRYNTRM